MPRREQGPQRRLVTVLFTDIVGSTERAAELGDRQWKRLLGAHHAIVRRNLKRFGGREIDTAGDGFFATFEQPAAAIECARATMQDLAAIDVRIRAGVHFGEVEFEGDNLSGMSVHIGARLMSAAGPGEIVVSSTVRDLMTGSDLPFADRGFQQFKGVEAQWHIYAVAVDTPERDELSLPAQHEPPPWHRRPLTVAIAAAALAAVIVGAIALSTSGPSSADTTPRVNALVRIDGSSVGAVVPVGTGPGGIAADGDSIWVANTGDQTVQRVDGAQAQALPAQGGLDLSPTAIATGEGSVWAGSSLTGSPSLVRINASQASSTATPVEIDMPVSGLAYGEGGLWITDRDSNMVAELDPSTGRLQQHPLDEDSGPKGIAVGDGSVWVALQDAKAVARIDPSTGDVTTIPISAGAPDSVAIGPTYVWVSVTDGDAVVRIDPASGETFTVADVGDGPTGIAAAGDDVWVALNLGGEVARIDAASGEVTERIPLGAGLGPRGVALTAAGVWVSIEPR